MKKCTAFFSAAVLLFALAGCHSYDGPEIESGDWKMTSVQSMAEQGQAVAFGPEGSSTLSDAVELELDCQAEDGVLTLTDRTIGTTYTGTYRTMDTSQESMIYQITLGEKEGTAVVSVTQYADRTERGTLILSVEDYALNFFAE